MKQKLELTLEGVVAKVHAPKPLKDKSSPRYGCIHTEFEMEQEWEWRGSRRAYVKNQTFWGELPKEVEGHRIQIFTDGNSRAVHDTETGKWYESSSSD